MPVSVSPAHSSSPMTSQTARVEFVGDPSVVGSLVQSPPWDLDGWPHVVWDGDDWVSVLRPDEVAYIPDTPNVPKVVVCAGVPSDKSLMSRSNDLDLLDSPSTTTTPHQPVHHDAQQAKDAT
jgi:hypothetical protein